VCACVSECVCVCVSVCVRACVHAHTRMTPSLLPPRVLEFIYAFMNQIALGEEDLCVAAGELSCVKDV